MSATLPALGKLCVTVGLVGSVRRRLVFQPRDHLADQSLHLGKRIVAIWRLGVHRGSNTRCELRQLDRIWPGLRATKALTETTGETRFEWDRSWRIQLRPSSLRSRFSPSQAPTTPQTDPWRRPQTSRLLTGSLALYLQVLLYLQ